MPSLRRWPPRRALADVAKAEEARRKSIKKPAKIIRQQRPEARHGQTLDGCDVDAGDPAAPAPTPGADAVNIALSPDPADAAEPDPKQEVFWTRRMTAARAALDRSRLFADALQSRINALTTDFVNRDDPAQRAVIEQDRHKALAELEKVRKEVADQTKAIADIQEEARKAGVPAAWVRCA